MSYPEIHLPARADILVVDDNEENVRLLADMLTAAGYTVRPATSGAMALRTVRARPPALILLDIRMPELDGYEVSQRLKADEKTRDIPIIFISVAESIQSKLKGFHVGGVDYITKPFDEMEVLARVKTHLALHLTQLDLQHRTAELEAANAKLLAEIEERQRVEAALRAYHEHLEELVEQRTAELQREITEHQQIEAALRISEEKYRMLVALADDVILLTDLNGRHLFRNSSYYTSLGFAVGEDIDLDGFARVHPDDAPRLKNLLKELLTQGVVSSEYRIQHQEGHWLYRYAKSKLIYDEENRPQAILAIIRDITERKQAEETLRESEERFRTLINSMDDVVYTLDRQQRHIGLYGHWVEKAGLTPEFFLGKTTREIFGAEAAAVHEAANARALAGETVIYEWSGPTPDGIAHYQTSVSPLMDAAGAITGIVGIGRNITERKRMEEALRLERDKAQQYFDNVSTLMVVLNKQGEVVRLNRKGHKILEYAEGELIGCNWFDTCLPVSLRAEVEQVFNRLITGQLEGAETYENVVVTRLGRERLIRWHNTILREADGTIVGTLASGEDITEYRQAEEALRQSEAQLRALFDLLPVGVSVVNQTYEVLAVNQRLEEILDLRWADLQRGLYRQRRYLRHDGLPMPPDEFASVRSVKEQRPIYHVETGVVKEDGRLVWTNVSAAPLPDGRVVVVTADITDRKRMEEALRESNLQLEKALTDLQEAQEKIVQQERLAAVGQLAAGIAHNFNNILTVTIGFAGLL